MWVRLRLRETGHVRPMVERREESAPLPVGRRPCVRVRRRGIRVPGRPRLPAVRHGFAGTQRDEALGRGLLQARTERGVVLSQKTVDRAAHGLVLLGGFVLVDVDEELTGVRVGRELVPLAV